MPEQVSASLDNSDLFMTGINGTTGNYLDGPGSLNEIYAAISDRPAVKRVLDDAHYNQLLKRQKRAGVRAFGLAAGIHAEQLSQTGWGLVVTRDAPPELLEALAPLLELRKEQVGTRRQSNPQVDNGQKDFFQIFDQMRGYQPNDTKQKFLNRLGRSVGQPADPRRGVPYYLLIAGSPREIPWSFQYDLDVEYAVGRIYFETDDGKPDYDAYYRYAKSVELSERRPPTLAPQIAFFAPKHDQATKLSSERLVKPLIQEITDWQSDRDGPWQITLCLDSDARKERLIEFMGGQETPSVLFTASHGMAFDKGDVRQLRHQGAIVCQGVGAIPGGGPIPETAYFSADDLPDTAKLHGMVSFHFACYGAGTPSVDDYPDVEDKLFRNRPLAAFPFSARLPQKMLAHPNGGALAFIGHVDRAWSCSFLLNQSSEQIDTFASYLKEVFDGMPVGRAMEYFNDRYAALATVLTSQFDRVRMNLTPDAAFIASVAATWLEHNDARNYVIYGDPAVRVRVASGDARGHQNLLNEVRRPAIAGPTISNASPSQSTPVPTEQSASSNHTTER